MSVVTLWLARHLCNKILLVISVCNQTKNTIPTLAYSIFFLSSSEALNLSDLPPNINNFKREREPGPSDRDNFYNHNQVPPVKRPALNFSTGFYLSTGIAAAAAAAAANFHQQNNSNNHLPQDSDGEDGDDDVDTQNTISNSMPQGEEPNRPALNGHHHQHLDHLQQLPIFPQNLQMSHHQQHVTNTNGNHDKSVDSAIENSSTGSGVSGGVDTNNGNGASGGSANTHIAPVPPKKIHLSKQQNNDGSTLMNCSSGGAGGDQSNSPRLGGVEDALNPLAGMQFRVARNGEFKLLNYIVKILISFY